MSGETVTGPSMPTAEQARWWLDRWDRQQEYYLADREERFAVIADVVAAATARPDPLVLDLGAGPCSLATRLLGRLPAARIVAVDADPLLLGLARVAHAGLRGLTIVDGDLRASDWAARLPLDRPVDAVVSTTALHWLTGPELAGLYRECARLLRPGGVFVDGDHFAEPDDRPALRDLTRTLRDSIAARVGAAREEDWAAWWAAVDQAPELAGLVGERGARPIDHSVPQPPTVSDHIDLLHAAGFAEAGTVWQHGDDRVLVAVR